MADLLLERLPPVEADSIEWPKVPHTKIESKAIPDKEQKYLTQPSSEPKQLQDQASKNTVEFEGFDSCDKVHVQSSEVNQPTARTQGVEATIAEGRDRRSPRLGIFGSKKTQWPNPHLSLGTQCNRLGSNECYKAIGPAQDLFDLISKDIGDLLDARIEDLEEGEPVAGHILLFDMYMVGKSASTAQPTLLFTCQRPKPRRRAIKYIRESRILKGHPKILLAESSLPPLVSGTTYLRLLSGRDTFSNTVARQSLNTARTTLTTMLKRDATPTPSPAPSPKASHLWIAGPVIGTVAGLMAIFALIFLTSRRRRNHNIMSTAKSIDPEAMRKNQNSPILLPVPIFVSDLDFVSFGPRLNPLQPPLQPTEITPRLPAPLSTSPEMVHIKDYAPIFKPSLGHDHSTTEQFSGSPILGTSSRIRATIGGIFYAKGKYYGFTAAHPFAQFCEISADDEIPSGSLDIDAEFSFISDDDEELREGDMSEITITSQASMSSVESVTSISRSNTTTSTVLNTQVDNTVDRTPVDNSVAAVFRAEEVTDTSTADERSAIGHLSKSSLNGADLGLDWALIELLNQSVYKARHDKGLAGIGTGLSVPRWLSSNPTTSISVSAATGFSGRISGVLLPGSTLMRLTPRGKFQEVWSVRFDRALAEGDSGAWVVDSSSSGLYYGHIVAGAPGGQVAYIIPARNTFKEIEKVLGPLEIVGIDPIERWPHVTNFALTPHVT
ncbi:hypothetical protein L207DRAFT_638433 [Hyaloscypha variabilis F]|uniref:Uncharacterized protein n=1 Tax=Hyaloscypha variabilis (strain UAMH 11265 / GT02V1 / F) TaxID=1149755 RepID=A0A2J6R8X0_HYAVF|nr:hypothetical protein L207DRAFT_638433 [Hyaloscypha variabilis F]